MHYGSFYWGLTKALAQIHFVTPSVTINQLVHACLHLFCNVMQLRRCRNPIWFSTGCQVSKELMATSPPAASFINAVFLHSGLFWIKRTRLEVNGTILLLVFIFFLVLCCHAAVFNHHRVSLNNKSLARLTTVHLDCITWTWCNQSAFPSIGRSENRVLPGM